MSRKVIADVVECGKLESATDGLAAIAATVEGGDMVIESSLSLASVLDLSGLGALI